MEKLVRVAEDGTIRIPPEYRQRLGLQEGDEILLRLQEESLEILTPRQAIERAQALVREYVPEGRSLVDELIGERRTEAERE